MANLPYDIEFGFITGEFIAAVADTTEDTNFVPDERRVTGSVRLVPRGERMLTTDKKVVLNTAETVDITDGWIVDRTGRRGMWLVTGAWTATITIPGYTTMTANFTVTKNNTESAPLHVTEYVGAVPVSPPPSGFGAASFGNYSFGN